MTVTYDVQDIKYEPEILEMEDNNIYRIIGIIDGYYIVKIPKGFKKAKVAKTNKKNMHFP